MKHLAFKNTDLSGHKGLFHVLSYFGEDVPEKFKKYMGKECLVKEEPCVIIGLEDNESMHDQYFIVYHLVSCEVSFELCNNSEFAKTIKL